MNAMDDDYVPGDEFDWDKNDPSQYCKHGTFIGSHWGPDLLCGYCEDGISDEEFVELMNAREHRHYVEHVRYKLFDELSKSVFPTFIDRIHQDPDGFAFWLTSELDTLKTMSTETLKEYVS